MVQTGVMADWNKMIIDEFRANGGMVANFGRGLVLLHHRGARTGTERVNPVAGLRESDDTWLVAASKGGAPENPAWYHNLQAHPDAEMETPDDGTVAVHAVELIGDERVAAWARFTAMSDGFRSYEEKTSRTIPVLRLTRR